jgi:hypothetical protein
VSSLPSGSGAESPDKAYGAVWAGQDAEDEEEEEEELDDCVVDVAEVLDGCEVKVDEVLAGCELESKEVLDGCELDAEALDGGDVELKEALGDESGGDDGAGLGQGPTQAGGGIGIGFSPPGIATSAGSVPPMMTPNRSSHQLFPSLFLSPGGPVTFCGGEFDAVGTGTTEVYDGGTMNVTLDALGGGIMLSSAESMSMTERQMTIRHTPCRCDSPRLRDV